MSLVNPLLLLCQARAQHYALGAFNVNNLETLQAVIRGAESCKTPVIVQTSEGAIEYAGLEELHCMIQTAAERARVPVALHLDHGKNMALIRKAIKIGYTSLMIDGSAYPYSKNVRVTKTIVRWAEKKNVCVEAELGTLGGKEDLVHDRIQYTDPDLAKDFAEKTGCDTLAVAIGTSHGAHKLSEKKHINLHLLAQIAKKVKIPLVLHGASMLQTALIARARKAGVVLAHAKGIPLSDIQKSIKLGIAKINTDTDLRIAFDTGAREFLAKNPQDIDPRHMLGHSRKLMQQVIEKHIKIFNTKRI
ncbi:MAG: class II fructose-bisphosphate aldolase [Candidatus Woesearchaeota archaeon]|nr:class II fructose-bisphosphate aldolase [Candidatus Woesearchaeota archaeon]